MELKIVEYLNHLWAGTFVDTATEFLSAYSFLFILWVSIALLSLLLDKKNGKRLCIALLIAIGFYFIVSEFIFKHLLIAAWGVRLRPYLVSDNIIPLGIRRIDSSFLSNHMSSTLAMLTVIIFYYRKVWPLAIIFILLMAFSRMHNGMHYPSDVLAGIILGIMLGFTGIFLTKRIMSMRASNL
ncbi:MAG: phosphatase PAP2 family protein [bacterium]|nr:phosphatase PAP2 family protein [bacterium]